MQTSTKKQKETEKVKKGLSLFVLKVQTGLCFYKKPCYIMLMYT